MNCARSHFRSAFFVVALLLLAQGTGCLGSRVKLAELAEAPIAVIHWDSESARRRAEFDANFDPRTPNRYRRGVAELGRLNSLLSEDASADAAARYPGRLALLNPRTREVTRIEQAPPGSRPLSWSSDHKRLLFTTDRIAGRHQIYSIDIESEEMRAVTGGEDRHVAGAYGKGLDIAFGQIARTYGGMFNADVRVKRKSDRAYVIDNQVAARHIDFSADGKQVVYSPQKVMSDPSRRARERPEIRVTSTDISQQPVRVGTGEHPVFTPDSKWIVYASTAGQAFRLRRVRPDGSGRTVIGEAVRSEATPAVSPDGNHVVYVSEHNGLNRLFIKRFDGTGDRLLYDDGAVAWPVW